MREIVDLNVRYPYVTDIYPCIMVYTFCNMLYTNEYLLLLVFISHYLQNYI